MTTAMVLITGKDNDLTLNRYVQGKFDSSVRCQITDENTIKDTLEVIEDYRARGIPAEA
jgi:hypothetical protein